MPILLPVTLQILKQWTYHLFTELPNTVYSVQQKSIVLKFSYGDTLPHTVVGVCGEFQWMGRFLQRGIWSQCVVPRSVVPSVRSSLWQLPDRTEQVLTRAEGRVEVVASLSQGCTAAAQCGLFTQKSVAVIFEPPCIYIHQFTNVVVQSLIILAFVKINCTRVVCVQTR